ncbi:pantoate--beta-alanine ligase [Flavobacterium selenitireducens]|uniref:pantoate--beta-alanine ligase n=1 Tax=Flavobacterium selenitireducens TaxID=2722704 RepID=UPI00168BD0F3|nr:pantoate--beta-alanine ligase [Flavobacterium selenitireducens]MBD3581793.1 pantoate--beta-alanine ligase [Flavobacterium selenitireducens]
MLIFNNQEALSAHLSSIRKPQTTTGFVPTMGALHDGHLSLLSESVAQNDITVISIFVNPTQFNNADDLAKYPRTLDADVAKIETVSADILVYAPSVNDIYGSDTVSGQFDFDGLENQMEGKFRPGHFDGVGTIVKFLFEIVEPTNAYFGEKDFQQLQIVRKLVSKHGIPVKVVLCPIFREPNGLAMSSRNERLAPETREKAAVIYKALTTAKQLFGTKSVRQLRDLVTEMVEQNGTFRLEYFEIADEATLVPVEKTENNVKYRAFIAVFANDIRLIDTVSLN